MTTVGEKSVGTSTEILKRRSTRARSAGLAAIAIAASLSLSACGPSYDYYVEGYWSNGDGVVIPSKTELFDSDGNPTCTFPVKWLGFEARSNPTNLARGVASEIMNRELDPNAPLSSTLFPTAEDQAKERLKRERNQNSLDILWQYTHPLFDADNAITTPEDLRSIKTQFQSALSGLGRDAPYVDYLEIVQEYVVTSDGQYSLSQIRNPAQYLADNNIPLSFQGLANEYRAATLDGVEYLLVRSKTTGITTRWLGDQSQEFADAIFFTRVDIMRSANLFQERPYYAEFLIQGDGCPDKDATQYDRFWLRSMTLFNPPVLPGEDTEPAVEPEEEASA